MSNLDQRLLVDHDEAYQLALMKQRESNLARCYLALLAEKREAGWLTFREVAKAGLARSNRWHKGGITDWTPSDWAVAMAGEAGEVCNAIKKLRRVQDEIANISDPDRQISSEREAAAKIGEELADTFLYLDLLAQRLGLDLAAEVIAKFNAVSEKYGFPERIGKAGQ